MEFRLFTLEIKGFFRKKIIISENDQPVYTVHHQGALGNLLQFEAHVDMPVINIDKPVWYKNERIIYIDNRKASHFTPSEFTWNFSLDSIYGNYHLTKDSIVKNVFTLSNSTTEIAKLSQKSIFKEVYGLAIHANEHIPFILALMTFVIDRRKKQKDAAG